MGEKLGQFLRKMKREQFLVLGLLGLLLLVLALPVKEKEEEAAQETAGEIEEPKISDEREQLQSQLEEGLSRGGGSGEVRVLITMDTMGERDRGEGRSGDFGEDQPGGQPGRSTGERDGQPGGEYSV